jgi:hypothetical protein
MSPDKLFERQIERIHRLIEPDGSVVTWNERIRDPDNVGQARQIDITIRRGGRLTLVECRLHKAPQDVNWVEELIGRRASLRADAVIAVSASGFTAGAKAKATSFGIFLRDLATLTDTEIQTWGALRKVGIVFCEFGDATLLLTMPHGFRPNSPYSLADANGQPPIWLQLYKLVPQALDEEKWQGQLCDFGMDVGVSWLLDGIKPVAVEFRGTIRRVQRDVELASASVYTDPLADDSEKQAHVGYFGLGRSEIIEASDDVSVIMDFSRVEVPPHCIFDYFHFDFGRSVLIKGVQFGLDKQIGLGSILKHDIPIRLMVRPQS